MPDETMTEGERIADLASGTMVTSHGNRLPPSIKRWIADRIDSALATRDAQLAAKDAEIERITNERDQLIQHAEVDPYVITDDGIVVCHACGAPKEPTNDHHT